MKLFFTLFCSLTHCFLPCCFSPHIPRPASNAVSPSNLSRPLPIRVVVFSFWPQPHVACPPFNPPLTLTLFLISWPTEHGFCILTLDPGKIRGQERAQARHTRATRYLLTDRTSAFFRPLNKNLHRASTPPRLWGRNSEYDVTSSCLSPP